MRTNTVVSLTDKVTLASGKIDTGNTCAPIVKDIPDLLHCMFGQFVSFGITASHKYTAITII